MNGSRRDARKGRPAWAGANRCGRWRRCTRAWPRARTAEKNRGGWSKELPNLGHGMFRAAWWSSNVLLGVALLSLIYTSGWEYSVRQYLDGFSDAIVPNSLPAEQKVEAILN